MLFAGKKTAFVSLLLVIFGAIQGFDWASLVTDPQMVGWMTTGIGVVMFVLRAVTSTEMFKSD